MRNMLLLTNSYPYGKGEAYLESEIPFYHDFDKIYICSLNVRKHQLNYCRQLPAGSFDIIPVPFASKMTYILYGFTVLFNPDLYDELSVLKNQKKLTMNRLLRLFIFLSRTEYEKRIILKYIKKKNISFDNGLIYSYRFEYQSYLAVQLREKIGGNAVIARAHRYDLYEYTNKDNYLPLRNTILQRIDKVYLISDDGLQYLSKKYPEYKDKMTVSRLGTNDYGIQDVSMAQSPLNIVSCSNVVPVKRMDRIIDAFMQLKNIEIVWTHFGDGPLFDEIQKKASALPDNIKTVFRGNLSNSELMKEYQSSRYHLFINVSDSEGVPVSIMEAMSFGIPCIATDVGGTKEIIDDGVNGWIIKTDTAVNELRDRIRSVSKMDNQSYQELRKNVRDKWESISSAKEIYKAFSDELLDLIA